MKRIALYLILLLPCAAMSQNIGSIDNSGGTINTKTVNVENISADTVINQTFNQTDTTALKKIFKEENDDDLAKVSGVFIDKDREAREKEAKEQQRLRRTITDLLNRKTICNWLPLGFNQFVNGETGSGIFFAAVQGGLMGASIGYAASADKNLRKHENPDYPPWARDRFHNKYINQRQTAVWLALATAGVVAWNYCDNFAWFRKNGVQASVFDWRGNMLVALQMSF